MLAEHAAELIGWLWLAQVLVLAGVFALGGLADAFAELYDGPRR